jgi:hypothetical protein
VADLKTQLADYFGHVVQHVDVEDVLEERLGAGPVRPLQPRAIPRSRWWLPVAAGFTGALIVIGALALLLRGDGTTVTDEPATTQPSPVEPMQLGTLTWTRVPHDEVIFGDSAMKSIVVFGESVIAVGESSEGAVVWRSADGLTWTRVPHDEAVFGLRRFVPPGQNAEMTDVVTYVGGLIAVGGAGFGPAVWTSPDGVTWSPSWPSDAPGGAGDPRIDGRIEAITEGGPGLVAVGPGVTTSSDGINWTREAGGFGYLLDVYAGGPGLIAAGVNAVEGLGGTAIYTSTDGDTWSRVPGDETIFGPEWVNIHDVTAGGPGFVAVGGGPLEPGDEPWAAWVWTSSDGLTWTRVPYYNEVFGDSSMHSVIATGDGLIAVGDSAADAAAWTSQDGISWTRVPHDETVFGRSSIQDVVAFGDRLVAVGQTPDGAASVWVASPPGSATAAALDSSATSQPLVTGENVNPWQKTEVRAPWAIGVPGVGIVDVTSLPDGGFALAAGRGGSILWSRDGVAWEEADPDGLVSPVALVGWPDDLKENLRVISGLPGRVAVLGGTGTDPVVWVGDLATRVWESIPLETTGLVDSFARVVIASSDDEVLVVAFYRGRFDSAPPEASRPSEAPDDYHHLVWLVDPDTGDVVRGTLPTGLGPSAFSEYLTFEDLEAEWFNDRWVIAMGRTTAVSLDGTTWTVGQDDAGLDSESSAVGSVTSLSAGPNRIIATTCGGWGPHNVWYSDDGLEWVQAPDEVPGPHSGSGYSDALGFVLVDDRGRLFTSHDGETWHWTLGPGRDIYNYGIAASGNSVLILARPPLVLTSE